MGKLHGALLILYLTAAAGYGGWRGRELWSGWGGWCLLLPPLALAVFHAFGDWRRNPYGIFVVIGLLRIVAAVVTIGGPALLLAWLVAEATVQWSAVPAVRAALGGGSSAAATALALAFGKPAGSRDTTGSENNQGTTEPDAQPNHENK